MMTLARGETSELQEVEINGLVEVFADLAFHGKRAEHAGCRVEMRKNFDQSVGSSKVVSSDLGRVLINTVNNAFEALVEKDDAQDPEFLPVVEVGTKKLENHIEIRIWDNGPGIPEDKVGEVFNPFFTTKPPGMGNVGLGLSLSYDIVVHQHQGKISVRSDPGAFTEFVIQLPLT